LKRPHTERKSGEEREREREEIGDDLCS